jgi:hypothetical protein
MSVYYKPYVVERLPVPTLLWTSGLKKLSTFRYFLQQVNNNLGSDISVEADYSENNNREKKCSLVNRRFKAPSKETDETENLRSSSTSKTSIWVKRNRNAGNIQAAIITF